MPGGRWDPGDFTGGPGGKLGTLRYEQVVAAAAPMAASRLLLCSGGAGGVVPKYDRSVT